MKRLWLVRLGRNGEFEQVALDKGILRIGFGIDTDISELKNREDLLSLITAVP